MSKYLAKIWQYWEEYQLASNFTGENKSRYFVTFYNYWFWHWIIININSLYLLSTFRPINWKNDDVHAIRIWTRNVGVEDVHGDHPGHPELVVSLCLYTCGSFMSLILFSFQRNSKYLPSLSFCTRLFIVHFCLQICSSMEAEVSFNQPWREGRNYSN